MSPTTWRSARQHPHALVGLRLPHPPSESGTLDYGLVNVEVQVGTSGSPGLVNQVADRSKCGAKGGWYYDNPSQPKIISLCATSCDPLLAASGSHLQVLIGCATVSEPVN